MSYTYKEEYGLLTVFKNHKIIIQTTDPEVKKLLKITCNNFSYQKYLCAIGIHIWDKWEKVNSKSGIFQKRKCLNCNKHKIVRIY